MAPPGGPSGVTSIETRTPFNAKTFDSIDSVAAARAYLASLGWDDIARRLYDDTDSDTIAPAHLVGAEETAVASDLIPSEPDVAAEATPIVPEPSAPAPFVPQYVVTLPFFCEMKKGNRLRGGKSAEFVEMFAARMRQKGVHAAPEASFEEEWVRFVEEG